MVNIHSPLFPKYLCINNVSIFKKPQIHQGKHLLNLTAVSSFSSTVIIHNKRLDLAAPIITYYKFYIGCVLNSCDGKTIFLKADWLCRSTTVLKCDPSFLKRRSLFILSLFGTEHDIFMKNFCFIIKK